MDPSVGEDIELLVFSEKEKCKIMKKEDIEDIKARLAPLSRSVAEGQVKTIGNIVEMREEINNLWEKVFAFKLFRSNERAISQIMKPCRSGEEFTNSIAALSLLIDQLNIKEMKDRIAAEREGSVNILEEFLKKEIKGFCPEIISNLRDIVTMRSKRFPVHITDPKFVETVIRITGKYPPNWSDLYLRALDLYKESLSELLNCLQRRFPT